MAESVEDYLKRVKKGEAGAPGEVVANAQSGDPLAQREMNSRMVQNERQAIINEREREAQANAAIKAREEQEKALAAHREEQRKRSMRHAEAQGVKVETNLDTGAREIAKHDDGAPVFEHGRVGKPVKEGDKWVETYRNDRGETIKEPVAGKTVKTPETAKTLGLNVGDQYFEREDDFGKQVIEKIGKDERVAKLHRIDTERDRLAIAKSRLSIERDEFDKDWEPIDSEFSDAQEEYNKLIEDPEYRQVDGKWVDRSDEEIGGYRQAELNNWRSKVASAQKRLGAAKSKRKALEPDHMRLSQASDKIKSQIQRLAEDEAMIELGTDSKPLSNDFARSQMVKRGWGDELQRLDEENSARYLKLFTPIGPQSVAPTPVGEIMTNPGNAKLLWGDDADEVIRMFRLGLEDDVDRKVPAPWNPEKDLGWMSTLLGASAHTGETTGNAGKALLGDEAPPEAIEQLKNKINEILPGTDAGSLVATRMQSDAYDDIYSIQLDRKDGSRVGRITPGPDGSPVLHVFASDENRDVLKSPGKIAHYIHDPKFKGERKEPLSSEEWGSRLGAVAKVFEVSEESKMSDSAKHDAIVQAFGGNQGESIPEVLTNLYRSGQISNVQWRETLKQIQPGLKTDLPDISSLESIDAVLKEYATNITPSTKELAKERNDWMLAYGNKEGFEELRNELRTNQLERYAQEFSWHPGFSREELTKGYVLAGKNERDALQFTQDAITNVLGSMAGMGVGAVKSALSWIPGTPDEWEDTQDAMVGNTIAANRSFDYWLGQVTDKEARQARTSVVDGVQEIKRAVDNGDDPSEIIENLGGEVFKMARRSRFYSEALFNDSRFKLHEDKGFLALVDRYAATGNPALIASMRDYVLTDDVNRTFAQENLLAVGPAADSKLVSPGIARNWQNLVNSYKGAQTAPAQEIGLEFLSLGSVKMAKTLIKTLIKGGTKAGVRAKIAGSIHSAGKEIRDSLAKVKVTDTLAKPAGRKGKLYNKVVDGAPGVVAGSLGEGLQEGVMAFAETKTQTSDVWEAVLMGMVGGPAISPLMSIAAAPFQAFSKARTKKKEALADKRFTKWYNEVFKNEDGFEAITEEDAGTMRQMLSGRNVDGLVSEYQKASETLTESQGNLAKLKVEEGQALQPAEQAAFEEHAAKLKDSYNKMVEAEAAMAEIQSLAIEAYKEIASMPVEKQTRFRAFAKVAAGNESLLTNNERQAIAGAKTEENSFSYFTDPIETLDAPDGIVTTEARTFFTPEGRAEIAKEAPAVADLILGIEQIDSANESKSTEESSDMTPESSNESQESETQGGKAQTPQGVKSAVESAMREIQSDILVTFVESTSAASGGMEATPAGISVSLSELESQVGQLDSPEAVKERVKALMDEEVTHVAQFRAVEAMMKEAGRSDFGAFFNEFYAGVWEEFTPEQKKAITDLYDGMPEASGALSSEAKAAAEGIRMLIQQRAGKQVTELTKAFAQAPTGKLKEFLERILSTLKELATTLPSEAIKSHIEAVESLIAGASVNKTDDSFTDEGGNAQETPKTEQEKPAEAKPVAKKKTARKKRVAKKKNGRRKTIVTVSDVAESGQFGEVLLLEDVPLFQRINAMGGILSKTNYAKRGGKSTDLYEGAGKYPPALNKLIYSENGLSPDQVATALHDGTAGVDNGESAQFLDSPSPDSLWRAIDESYSSIAENNRQMRSKFKEVAKESEQKIDFEEEAFTFEDTDLALRADSLVIGDKLTIDGEEFTVEGLKRDSSGSIEEVVMKDGPRFGRQVVDGNATLYVEEYEEFIEPDPNAILPEEAADEGLGEDKTPKTPKTPTGFTDEGADLLQNQTEDFALAQDTTLDGEKISKAQEEVAQAKEQAEKDQQSLNLDQETLSEAEQALVDELKDMGLDLQSSADKPKKLSDNSFTQPIPPEKIGSFVQIAQKFISEGVDSPTKLVATLEKLGKGKIRPYTDAIWSAFRMADPSLEQVQDWGVFYNPAMEPNLEKRIGLLATRISMNLFKNQKLDRKALVEEFNKDKAFSNKEFDELIEASIVDHAWIVFDKGEATFSNFVRIYMQQPKLSAKTSSSKIKQAYSTPVPLAAAASILGDIQNGKVIMEPTAGHGMLLVQTHGEQTVYFNELDTDRAERAKAIVGESANWNITTEDGATFSPPTKVDRIISNPPFGSVTMEDGSNKVFQTPFGETTQIDHAIVANSLESMTDDGRAVFIIGGPPKTIQSDKARAEYYSRGAKARFFDYLYKNHGVVDHMTVNGDLYAKQGAGWPVDVIVIQGKAPTKAVLPSAKPPTMVNAWSELSDILNENDKQRIERRTITDEEIRDSVEQGLSQLDSLGGRADDILEPASNRPDSGSGGSGGRGSNATEGQPGDASEGAGVSGSVDDQGQAQDTAGEPGDRTRGESGGIPERAPRTEVSEPASVKQATRYQAEYKPVSGGFELGTLIPHNMAAPVAIALNRVKKDIGGDLIGFVRDKLGYPKEKDITPFLAGEQIDAIALAIWNFERGGALIIGDQTGIGKGRIAAGLIKYAINNGKVPVFLTAQDQLGHVMISDDLADIEADDVLPAELNTKRAMPVSRERRLPFGRVFFDKVADTGQMGDEANAVFSTYYQVGADVPKGLTKKERNSFKASGKAYPDGWRMKALKALGDKAIFILDEAHKGAGQSNIGYRIQDLVRNSGVAYLSATAIKRPDNMGVYYRTNVGALTDNDPSKIIELMKSGGVPAMQIVSSMLAADGQMLRRERSFEGVDFATQISEDTFERDAMMADKLAGAIKQIIMVQDLIQDAVDTVNEMVKSAGKNRGVKAGNRGGIESANFASTLHNLVSQYLLSIKTEATIETALKEIQAGNKVVVALSSTMESAIETAEMSGFDLTFKGVVQAYLDKQRFLKINNKDGKTETAEIRNTPLPEFEDVTDRQLREMLTSSSVDAEGKSALKVNPKAAEELLRRSVWSIFERAKKALDQIDLGDLPLSPIDTIRNAAEAQGIKTGEITGRSKGIDVAGEVYERPARERGADAKVAVKDEFNNGDLDLVILNQSGSTGISLHASDRVQNKKQRTMIVAQPHLDINEFMQMLGRIHRSGQVVLPKFILLQTALPAEKRPAAVLGTKMAQLNANTTSNAKTEVSDGNEAVDLFNKYGDKIAYETLANDPDLQRSIYPLANATLKKLYKDGGAFGMVPWESAESSVAELQDGALAKTITGYLAALPVEDQSIFWETTISNYQAYISYLDEMGENDLEAKVMDIRAKVQKREVYTGGGNGDSAFDAPSYLETVETQLGDPPLSGAEAERIRVAAAQSSSQQVSEYQKQAKNAIDRRIAAKAQSVLTWDSEKESQLRSKLNDARNKIVSAMSMVGKYGTVKRQDGTTGLGIVESVVPGDNTLAPSDFYAVILVNDTRRQLKIALSQFSDAFTQDMTADSSEWDATLDSSTTRSIVTGNLAAALEEASGRGSVIEYTTDKGDVQLGLLLPKGVTDQAKAKEMNSIAITDGPMMQKSLDEGRTITNVDNSVQIKVSNEGKYTLEVPSNQSIGGKYWRNPKLNRVLEGGQFIQVSNKMRGTISEDSMNQAFEVIREIGGTLSAGGVAKRKPDSLQSSPETLTPFPASYRSRGIAREDMPQIGSGDHSAFSQFVKARGYDYKLIEPKAANLRPTQAEYNPAKVKKAKGFDNSRSILVSSDGFILDGHHQWKAAEEQGDKIPAIRFTAPIDTLLELAFEFPSEKTGGSSLQSSPITPSQDAAYLSAVESGDMETAQKMVDEKLSRIGAMWHGTPSGDLKGAKNGLHVGTKQSAMEALEARIGIPADGKGWNGDREYGKTLLAGRDRIESGQFGKYRLTGYNVDAPANDYYPDKMPPVGSEGLKTDPRWKPWLRPVLIVGEMTNTKRTPISDNSANRRIKRKRGAFYINEAEDVGSISAVLPNGDSVRVKLADPVTYDEAGNVIRLSERFNENKDSILYSSPDKSDLRKKALETLFKKAQPLYREVFGAVLADASLTPKEIAETYGISEKGVMNITKAMKARLRSLMAAAESEQGDSFAPDRDSKTGLITGGRPDLALSLTPEVARIDQERSAEGQPDVRTHEEAEAKARGMLAKNYAGTIEELEKVHRGGGLFTDVQTMAAKLIIANESAKAATMSKERLIQLASFVNTYREEGTEAGRALSARRDPQFTPQERARLYLVESMVTPTGGAAHQLRKAESAAKKKDILSEWVESMIEVREGLKTKGFDVTEALEWAAQADEILQEAEQQSPLGDYITIAIQKADPTTKVVATTIRSGAAKGTPIPELIRQAANASATTPQRAAKLYQDFQSYVLTIRREAMAKGADLALSASAEEMADLEAIGLIDISAYFEADGTQKKSPPKKSPKRHKNLPPARDRPRSEWDAWVAKEMDRKFKRHQQLPNNVQPPKPLEYFEGAWDLNDPKASRELVTAMGISAGVTWDKLLEWRKMSILTGIKTHVTNIASNTLFSGYELIPKRLLEASYSDALSLLGFKDKGTDTPTLSEFLVMSKNIFAALKRGADLLVRSYRTRAKIFEAETMAMPQLIDFDGVKADHIPPKLRGKIASVLRTLSFDTLTAFDEMAKGMVGTLEASAYAHRLAKKDGLKGSKYEAFIANEMEYGSRSWAHANRRAQEMTFQAELGQSEAVVDQVFDGMAQAINRGKKGKFKVLLDLVFPFVNTPTNIFKKGWNYSPLGSATALIDMTRAIRALSERDKNGRPVNPTAARAKAEQLYNRARLMNDLSQQTLAWAGTMAIYSILEGEDDEDALFEISGNIPYSGPERDLRDLAYRREMGPYTVRIGDLRVQYNRYEPVATAVGFAVDAMKAFRKDTDAGTKAMAIGGIVMGASKDKTYLRGVSDLVRLWEDSQHLAEGSEYAQESASYGVSRWIGSQITSMVPNLYRQASRSSDEFIREREVNRADPLLIQIGQHIGADLNSRSQTPKIDLWGNEIENHGGVFLPGPITKGLEPDVKDDYLAAYARKNGLDIHLKRVLRNVPFTLTQTVNKRQGSLRMDAETRAEYAKIQGEILSESLNGFDWDPSNPTREGVEFMAKKRAQAASIAKRRILNKNYDQMKWEEPK